jgi:type IX secretion system PorP/SprF family membrane protein
MKFNYLVLLFLILTIGNTSVAQDPRFSQFFNMPLFVNPALTGKFDGIFRLATIHRRQWVFVPNAYITTGASFDISVKRMGESDDGNISRTSIAFGVAGLADKSSNGALKLNHLAFSGSMHFDLGNDQTIGWGAQYVTGSFLVDQTKLEFGNQITSSGFNSAIPSGVNFNIDGRAPTKHINVGVLYCKNINTYTNLHVGMAMSNFVICKNKKKYSVLENQTWKHTVRTTINAGITFPLPVEKVAFKASALYQVQNGKVSELEVGGTFIWNLHNEVISNYDGNEVGYPTNIYLGAWIRTGDAIYPYFGLDLKNNIKLGITYDINISSLKSASKLKGGPEISIIYTFKNLRKSCSFADGNPPDETAGYKKRKIFWHRF